MPVRMRRLICMFLDRNLNAGFVFRDGIVHIVKKLLLDNLGTYMFIFIYCLFIVHTVYILYYALPRGGNKRINQSINQLKKIFNLLENYLKILACSQVSDRCPLGYLSIDVCIRLHYLDIVTNS